jgi:hypothetical protein
VSVNVSGPGDSQVALVDDSSPLSVTDGDNVLMPPSIKKNYKQLHLKLIRGEKLPKTDTFGSIDAFVQVTFNGQKLKSRTVTQSHEVVEWNQEFLLPIQYPSANDTMIFKLWDENKVSDELVGSLKFSIKEMTKATSEAPVYRWVNVYGAPLGVSGDNTDIMNNNPEMATQWKGRILVMYYSEDTKKPVMKMKDLLP